MPDYEPIVAARFSLTVDGNTLGTFEELAGLNESVDTVDYVESGDDLLILTKLPPGGTKPKLRLGRPKKATDLRLSAWYDTNARVRPTPKKNCTLIVHEAGHTDARFLLPNAWLSALVTEQRTTGGFAATWELATLVCDRIQRI